MTLYGASAGFMDAIAYAQRQGTSGHIEYFPPTFALRGGHRLAFVRHALRGRKVTVQEGCGESATKGHAKPEPKGGTFSYCCQATTTADAENWCALRPCFLFLYLSSLPLPS